MPDNRTAEGKFAAGASGNPGGRPRQIAELEKAIRDKHGPQTLDVLDKLYELAMGQCTGERTTMKGGVVTVILDPDVNAAKLYLDRVLGPVKAADDDLRKLSESELEERIAAALGLNLAQLRLVRAGEAADAGPQ